MTHLRPHIILLLVMCCLGASGPFCYSANIKSDFFKTLHASPPYKPIASQETLYKAFKASLYVISEGAVVQSGIAFARKSSGVNSKQLKTLQVSFNNIYSKIGQDKDFLLVRSALLYSYASTKPTSGHYFSYILVTSIEKYTSRGT